MRLSWMPGSVVSLLLSVILIPPLASPAVAVQPGAAAVLDPVSSTCFSCHDGSGGPQAGFCLLPQKNKGCGGHIVSASYAELARRNKNLHPQRSLPPELVLFEGKITCVTCHGSAPHNRQPFAIDNRGSALCHACHVK